MMVGQTLMMDLIDCGEWDVYRDGKRIGSKDLVIGTNSIDVTLGNKFTWIRQSHADPIDPYDPGSMSCTSKTVDHIILQPGETVLGYTRERFDLKGYKTKAGGHAISPMYDGRSTCGRLFLASHITAGYGDVGFNSCWTLELKNMNHNNALKLYAGMRIGQVSFHLIFGCVAYEYVGAYRDQNDAPKPPVLGRDRF